MQTLNKPANTQTAHPSAWTIVLGLGRAVTKELLSNHNLDSQQCLVVGKNSLSNMSLIERILERANAGRLLIWGADFNSTERTLLTHLARVNKIELVWIEQPQKASTPKTIKIKGFALAANDNCFSTLKTKESRKSFLRELAQLKQSLDINQPFIQTGFEQSIFDEPLFNNPSIEQAAFKKDAFEQLALSI